jgi:hypothetical protein
VAVLAVRHSKGPGGGPYLARKLAAGLAILNGYLALNTSVNSTGSPPSPRRFTPPAGEAGSHPLASPTRADQSESAAQAPLAV